jgi:hypothetical protein
MLIVFKSRAVSWILRSCNICATVLKAIRPPTDGSIMLLRISDLAAR